MRASLAVLVLGGLVLASPAHSQSTLARTPDGAELWVASELAASVSVVDTRTETLVAEIALGAGVTSLAIHPDGRRVFAAQPATGRVLVLDRARRQVTGGWTVTGDPHALALAPNGSRLFALSRFHRALHVFDPDRPRPLARLANPGGIFDNLPANLVVSDDGDGDDLDEFVWVVEFSSSGSQIDLAGNGPRFRLPRVVKLAVSNLARVSVAELGVDPDDWTGGLPTNLRGLALAPGGRELWVLGENANTARGIRARFGGAPTPHPMNDRVFVRTDGRYNGPGAAHGSPPVQAVIRRVDRTTGRELANRRLALSDDRPGVSRTPVGGPCDAAWTPSGDHVYVLNRTSGNLTVLDARTDAEVATLELGFQPTTIVFGAAGKAYVHVAQDFGVVVLDTSQPGRPRRSGFVATTTSLPLSATELDGLRLFSHGRIPSLLPASTKISLVPQMACVSCHPDGHTNGLVWDQTEIGRGARLTQSLLDWHSSQRLGWDAFRDEMQDFVNAAARIEAGAWNQVFGPSLPDATNDPAWGVGSNAGVDADLDAVAQALGTVFGETSPSSGPGRLPDGSFSASAQRGYEVFVREGCIACHPVELGFTDSGVPYDGINLGIPLHPGNNPDTFKWEPGTLGPLDAGTPPAQHNPNIDRLAGLDAPSLRHLYTRTAFFHDGHALSLDEVIAALGSTHADVHAGPGVLGHPSSSATAADLKSFLLSLDGATVPYADTLATASVGTRWQYGVRGDPGTTPVVLASTGRGETTVPGLGTLLIDAASALILHDGLARSTPLDSRGVFDLYLQVPRDPNLVGFTLVLQSILFDGTPSAPLGITNTRAVTIVP